MAIFGAILAAGAAERFGAPKLLLPAGPGETVLSQAIRRLLAAVDGSVLVVLPAEDALHRAALAAVGDPRALPVANPRSLEGLGTSVAAAARVAQAEGAEALLLMPSDLPFFPLSALSRMVRTFRAQAPWAVATANAGEPQTPALFGAQALAPLSDRQGAHGAKPLLKVPRGPLALEEGLPAQALSDLDRWPAYAAAASALGWSVEAASPVRWVPALEQVSAGAIWQLGDRTQAAFRFAPQPGEILAAEEAGRVALQASGGPHEALLLLRCAAHIALGGGAG